MKLRNLAALIPVAALLALAATPAQGAVGMEAVSRHAAPAGATVDLTIGCGFCFPPCYGPHGQPDGTCMPRKRLPPRSFPISLVPIAKAPQLYSCGPRALCSPAVAAPPRRFPYRLLGSAAGPDYVQRPEGGRVPRYSLTFTAPQLTPGVYAYVIFCDVCQRGESGSLVASPGSRNWRLRILPPR